MRLRRCWSLLEAVMLIFVVLYVTVVLFLSDRIVVSPRRAEIEEEDPNKIISDSPLTVKYRDSISDRHVLLENRCYQRDRVFKYNTDNGNVPPLPGVLIISTSRQFSYCPLAEAGSKLLRRYISAITKPGLQPSPFDIDLQDTNDLELLSGMTSELQQRKFLDLSFKFVFTRDPYWRIFSAYIDKIFSPNHYFWKRWGSKIVRQYNMMDPSSLPCVSGISFQNFVKLVVEDLYEHDIHVIPMTKACALCNIRYDLVGKMEYAKRDIDYLAGKLNVSSRFQHRESYKMETARDIIIRSTNDLSTGWINTVKNCTSITMYTVGRMIWRRLQIEGIILAQIFFPFSREEMENVSLEQFQTACVNAAQRSTDVTKLNKQKTQAFVEAYKQVSFKTLIKLREVYRDDFHLLGYDIAPDMIYRSDRRNVNYRIMDFRKQWK